MKQYPSIQGPSSGQNKFCYAFVKYDGSNMRFEWSNKRGWYKFGTRKTMINAKTPIYGQSVEIFLEKYSENLDKIFRRDKYFRGIKNVIVFGEFFGSKSFAGNHKPWDKKDVVLFDVNPIKKGLLGPKQFLDTFGHLEVAECVYSGNFGKLLVEEVKQEKKDISSKHKLRAEIPEGVICKGGQGHNLWMCKIKTDRYMEALKSKYDKDWIKYWE